MSLLQVLCAAFFLLVSGVYADSCVNKPCGSDYQVTSWNPVRDGAYLVYYYEVTTDGCYGVVFTDVLLQMSLSCENCAIIKCYNSHWDEVSCPTYTWETSDSFLATKHISAGGLKWTLPPSTSLRFSISVNPSTTTTTQSKIYTKGNSWNGCPVCVPVCNCACPPCPGQCYRSHTSTYPNCQCNNCTNCTVNTYEISPCNTTVDRVCKNCTVCQRGTFQVAPCTAKNDTTCHNCTVCQQGQWQVAPCTAKNDTTCHDCMVCQHGSFQVAPCTAKNDTTCQKCSNCTALEEVVSPCNATHDVICAPCPTCNNCSGIPHSHITNNGLNCSCNEGYDASFSEGGFLVCTATPCCADCQACGFNASIPCFGHQPNFCDYSCLPPQGDPPTNCNLNNGFDPHVAGFTVLFNGATYDSSCCDPSNQPCSCFNYIVASSVRPLNSLTLGVSCNLVNCDPSSPSFPCLLDIAENGQVNSANNFMFSQFVGFQDPNTGVTGIFLSNFQNPINASAANFQFVFQGHLNVSEIPITLGLTGQDTSSLDCVITTITGPDCVDCSTNTHAAT